MLFSIRYVLSTWHVELSSNRNHSAVVESATKWFAEALMDLEEVLHDMIDRQIMEAESLQARQTAELVGKIAPMLRVSFPFPEVFEKAKQELCSVLTFGQCCWAERAQTRTTVNYIAVIDGRKALLEL